MHVEQRFLGKNRITHYAFVDHSAKQEETFICHKIFIHTLKIFHYTNAKKRTVHILGLSSGEGWVLGADVTLGTGGRLEGHGAAWALVEDLAVSSLNVGLDGV